jgi:hypothetical protein
VASLPDFGGADGMIIQVLDSEIDHAIDPRVVEFGKAHNLFYAFLYPNSYEQYNKSRFREALEDWGYYGAEDRRPSWFTKNLQKR